MIWSLSFVYQEENEEIEERIVRFRTVDMSTAAVDLCSNNQRGSW
jgi:sulfate adenylyltransferase subunit 2